MILSHYAQLKTSARQLILDINQQSAAQYQDCILMPVDLKTKGASYHAHNAIIISQVFS